MQSAVEDVILLDYMRQSDHGEHTDSLTCIDIFRFNVSRFGIEEHSDMLQDMGRNNSIPHMDRKQSFTSAFEEDPMWYLELLKILILDQRKCLSPKITTCTRSCEDRSKSFST
jgi:hypothetical protein